MEGEHDDSNEGSPEGKVENSPASNLSPLLPNENSPKKTFKEKFREKFLSLGKKAKV
jgi:hypothetical protein